MRCATPGSGVEPLRGWGPPHVNAEGVQPQSPGSRGAGRVNVPAVGGRRISTPKAFNPKARGHGSAPPGSTSPRLGAAACQRRRRLPQSPGSRAHGPGQRSRVPPHPEGVQPMANSANTNIWPRAAHNCRTPSGCRGRRFDTRGACETPGSGVEPLRGWGPPHVNAEGVQLQSPGSRAQPGSTFPRLGAAAFQRRRRSTPKPGVAAATPGQRSRVPPHPKGCNPRPIRQTQTFAPRRGKLSHPFGVPAARRFDTRGAPRPRALGLNRFAVGGRRISTPKAFNPKARGSQRTPGQRSRGWGPPYFHAEGVQPQSPGVAGQPGSTFPRTPRTPKGCNPTADSANINICPRPADNCPHPFGVPRTSLIRAERIEERNDRRFADAADHRLQGRRIDLVDLRGLNVVVTHRFGDTACPTEGQIDIGADRRHICLVGENALLGPGLIGEAVRDLDCAVGRACQALRVDRGLVGAIPPMRRQRLWRTGCKGWYSAPIRWRSPAASVR